MRRSMWIALVVLGGLLFSAALFRPQVSVAQESVNHGTLDVTGQGVLTVDNDTASITLGFSTLRDTPAGAYQDMSDSMNKVVAALKAIGVQDKELKTGTFNLADEYDWSKSPRTFAGYRATNTLVITTQSLDKVADLIDAAVKAGANQVSGVNYSIKDTDELVDKALDLAVDDAKAKAERVAKRMGATVGGVLHITIQTNNREPVYYTGAPGAKAMDSGAAPVFSGTGEFRATVTVTFELN